MKREGTPSCVPAIFHFSNGERLSPEPHDTVLLWLFDSLAVFDLELLASLLLTDLQVL